MPVTHPISSHRTDDPGIERSRDDAASRIEQTLWRAVHAAHWKSEDRPRSDPKTSRGIAVGTAIEIDRRCRVFDTPIEITVCSGAVSPTSSAKMVTEETPLIRNGEVSPPDWTTTATDHTWLEVEVAGTPLQFIVDASVPPQVTGAPEDAGMHRGQIIQIQSTSHRPDAYSLASVECQSLSEFSTTTVPWSKETETWPFGTPEPVSTVPADGGSSVSVTANTVVEMDARDGLAQLPADSVDLIITSPPYRLQRSYPDAETIWGGHPDCHHTWNTEQLYTDTPIRSGGGAGFNSSSDPDELREERWRDSTTCPQCGAWKGQLGLEPTVEEYIDHLTTLFSHVKRVLKPAGSLWVNIADSYSDGHRDDDGNYRDSPEKGLVGVPPRFEMAMRSDGWIPRERCAWTKPVPTPDPAHDRRTPAWEYVYRFVLTQDYTDATPQGATDILEFETASGNTDHSAPMPTELPETIIDTTLPADQTGVVVDPFAGSGTVLEAAAEADHDYLGFEISSEAAATARDRLAQYDRKEKSLSGQASISSFS